MRLRTGLVFVMTNQQLNAPQGSSMCGPAPRKSRDPHLVSSGWQAARSSSSCAVQCQLPQIFLSVRTALVFFYKVHPANRLMRATEGMKLNLLPSTDIPSNHTPAACSTSSSLQAISFRNVKSILSLIQYDHVNSAANSTYFANTCKWSIVKLTVFTASTSSYISH